MGAYIESFSPRQFPHLEVDDEIEKRFDIVSSAELDVVVGVDACEDRVEG
jgi:hypothetical protein